jgi:hypothetical protein
MKFIAFLALLATSASASDTSCLIVKHASTAHQVFVSGANWQYVAGEFPKGMKWKSNITDRNIRKIKHLGGHVVIVPTKYTVADLKNAQQQCSELAKQGSAPSRATEGKH